MQADHIPAARPASRRGSRHSPAYAPGRQYGPAAAAPAGREAMHGRAGGMSAGMYGGAQLVPHAEGAYEAAFQPPGSAAPVPNLPPLAAMAASPAAVPVTPAELPALPRGAMRLPLTAVVLGAETELGRQLIKECLRMEAYTGVVAISEQPIMLASELKLSPERSAKLKALVVSYDMIEDGLRPLVYTALRVVAFSCMGVTKADAGSPREFNRLNYEVPMRFVATMLEGNILRVSVLSQHMAYGGSSVSEIRRLRGFMEDEMRRFWQDEFYIQTWLDKGLEPGLVFFQTPMLLTPGLRSKGKYRHLTDGEPFSRKQLAKQRLALRFGFGPNFAMKTRDVAKAMAHEARTYISLIDTPVPEHRNQIAQLHSYEIEAEEIEELAEQCREDEERNVDLSEEHILRNRLMARAVTYDYGEAALFDRQHIQREFEYIPPTVAAKMGATSNGLPLDAVRERELVEFGARRERDLMHMQLGAPHPNPGPPLPGAPAMPLPLPQPPPPPLPGIGGTTAPRNLVSTGPEGPFLNNPGYPSLIQDPSFRPGGPEYEAFASTVRPQVAAWGGFGAPNLRDTGANCYPGMHLSHIDQVRENALHNEMVSRMDPLAVEDGRYETSRMLGRPREMKEYDLEETRQQRKPPQGESRMVHIRERAGKARAEVGHNRTRVRRRRSEDVIRGVPQGIPALGMTPGNFEGRATGVQRDANPPCTSGEALEARVAFEQQLSRRQSDHRRTRRNGHHAEEMGGTRTDRRSRVRAVRPAVSMYSSGSDDDDNDMLVRGGSGNGYGGGEVVRPLEIDDSHDADMDMRRRGRSQRNVRREDEHRMRTTLRHVGEEGDEISYALRKRVRNLADRFLGPDPRSHVGGRRDPAVEI